MNSAPPRPRVRLDALTSLRFFAAFHVVLFHVHPALPGLEPNHPLKVGWAQFCANGFTAVSFFFTLSGFILAYNYPPTREVAARTFYRARFARIYPVYVFGLVLGLPFLAMRVLREGSFGGAALEVALAVALLQAWVPWLWFAVNAPGWSLSVEAFFYGVFPWAGRRLAALVSSERRALGTLAALYMCAQLPALLGIALSDTGMSIQDETASANFVRYMPLFACRVS
jgi:peptidoglycan/LPS O-acetylase OafA/YrhL